MSLIYVSEDPNRERGRRKSKFFLYSKSGHLDRIALRISRFWHQDPRWFLTLPPETQTDLIADYILEHESQKERDERKSKYNIQQARRLKERLSDG